LDAGSIRVVNRKPIFRALAANTTCARDGKGKKWFVILSDRTLSAAKWKGVEGPVVALVWLLGCMMRGMHSGGYFTYIMASRSHTLYVGMTGDLHERVFKHKWKEHDGFTARYNCDRLVWFESHQDVTKSIEREKQLKGWRREKKIALIEKMNPAWVDLSRDWYDVEPADWKRVADRMDL
jgi:putative endonuclease